MKKLGMIVLAFAAIIIAGSAAQAADDAKFTIHGEARVRGEWFTNMSDFTDTDTNGPGTDDDTFDVFPWRIRVGVKGDLGNDIWFYSEFQGNGQWGTANEGTTRDFFGDDTNPGTDVDVYQGYVTMKDLGSSSFDLTIGRQEIAFDSGLQFSSLDFYNGIAHDGAMLAWDNDKVNLHAFVTKEFEDESGATLPSSTSHFDEEILGVHVGQMLGKDKDQDLSYYLYYLVSRDGSFTTKVYTAGARWAHDAKESGILWSAELAIQTGDASSSLDQSSTILEGEIGWKFGDAGKHRVALDLLMASGDDDPTDSDINTYMPLFTDFHNRLGYADLFSPQNITAYSVGYDVAINDKHGFGAQYYMFSKAEDEDFVYGSPISNLPGSASTGPCTVGTCEDDLGTELDLVWKYAMADNLGVDVAWSIYTPGDAFEVPTGQDDTAWRLSAQARARW